MFSYALKLLLLTYSVQSVNSPRAVPAFDCKHVKAGNSVFDLSGLPSPVLISNTEMTPPTSTRTEININLCDVLEREPVAAPDQCPPGTRICMKVFNVKNGDERLTQVIASGGSDSADWIWSADLGAHLEGAEKVLELELHGSKYAERTQKTEIDLKCDRNAAKDKKPTMMGYDKADGKLKLEWVTPHACAQSMGDGGSGGEKDDSKSGSAPSRSSGGWGFFSWFFFFIFIGGIAYFSIGLWRNYNEYGVIELPNKDFWREAPYIAKDVGKHIYSTVSGQGSNRGAYEPV